MWLMQSRITAKAALQHDYFHDIPTIIEALQGRSHHLSH
jgi:hypothetical protein